MEKKNTSKRQLKYNKICFFATRNPYLMILPQIKYDNT